MVNIGFSVKKIVSLTFRDVLSPFGFDEAQYVVGSLKGEHNLYALPTKSIVPDWFIRKKISLHFENAFKDANVIFCNYRAKDKITKSAICKDKKINIIVEDVLAHTIECAEAGIQVLLLDETRKESWAGEGPQEGIKIISSLSNIKHHVDEYLETLK